jgi:Protein of unknown function (DUF1565)
MRSLAAVLLVLLLAPATAAAQDWYVAPGGAGDGSKGAPFGTIQAALDSAMPGDVVHVAPGTYTQGFQTRRAGMEGAPITVRGEAGVLVTTAGRVLTVAHPNHMFEQLVLDAQYADQDAVRIETAATATTLRGCEVRRAQRDCIDMGSPAKVLIDGCLVHHCLNATGGRTDAHGIVGAAVRDLTIRDTEIHTFSGDAIQLDPARTIPAWDNVTVEGCTFWLAPLPAAENGFPAGTVAGENAIDTKVPAGSTSHLTIRDTTAYGFRGGLITNMAAYNLKEGVAAELDGVTIHGSEIALRLRAPADVRVANAVIHDVDAAVRYEDNIVGPRLYNSTIGDRVTRAFVEASSSATVFDGRNVLVLGAAFPPELTADRGSLTVDASVFRDPGAGDYRLVAGSPPIDRGVTVDVATDRAGVARPQGAAHDVGAFEYCERDCAPTPPGDDFAVPGDRGGGCCQADRGTERWWTVLLVALWLRRRRHRRATPSPRP